MSNPTWTRWKPLPGYPGYQVNRSGWVRNDRGYVVASGKAATLFVEGGRTRLSRQQLLDLADEAFQENQAPSVPSDEMPQAQAVAVPLRLLDLFPGLALPALPPGFEFLGMDVAVEAPEAAVGKRTRKHMSRRQRETGDRGERYNPVRVLPLRDPWADGRIERQSEWDWAGVM